MITEIAIGIMMAVARFFIDLIPNFESFNIFEVVEGFTALAEFIAYASPFVPLTIVVYGLGIWFALNTLKLLIDAIVWLYKLIPLKFT